MKSKILNLSVFVFILLLSESSYAITTESLDKAVGNIESAYSTVTDLTADFTQKTRVVVLGKDITNQGTLRWKKPGMFFIEYSGENPRQYISNNKKVWVYVPKDTQVEVYTVSPKTVSREALEFMRGFMNIKKSFNITGWKKMGEKTELVLVPLSKEAPYLKLVCRFRGDHLLDEVAIHNSNGNTSTYRFSGIATNSNLPADLFEFKKPKGVKEVSVR